MNKKNSSKFVIDCLNYAHRLSLNGSNVGMINCPINKNLLKKNKIGVTEFLARKCKIKRDTEVMLIYNKKLAVSPITTHINLKEVSKKISVPLIVNKVIKINSWYIIILTKNRRYFGFKPHNAELKKIQKKKRKSSLQY